jgi:hypothetical protein
MKFINELKIKLLKKYKSGELIKSYYNDTLKYEYRRKKISESEFLKEYKSYNLNFKFAVFDEVKYKTIGTQKFFRGVRFSDFYEMLEFIGKKREFLEFEKYLNKDKDLKNFLKQNPKILLDNMDIWDKVLDIKNFFVKFPKPNIYIRELPIIGIDTKFIERHKKVIDKVLMEVCEYDKNIKTLANFGFEKKYFLKYPKNRIRFKNRHWNDIEINIEDLDKFKEKKLFIVENLQTYLAMPVIEHYLVVFGKGFQVASLKNHNYEIIYWSDIDKAGFSMLSMVRNFAKTTSFLMDLDTFKKFEDLAVEDNKREYSNLNLTGVEKKCFEYINNKNKRLEQERIPFWYVKKKLKEII